MLRVITLVFVLLISFVILVFFTFGRVWVLVPASVLLIAVVGWVGAIRAHKGLVNFLWIGLLVWTLIFAGGMLTYTGLARFHTSAVDRCSNMPFALTYAHFPVTICV